MRLTHAAKFALHTVSGLPTATAHRSPQPTPAGPGSENDFDQPRRPRTRRVLPNRSTRWAPRSAFRRRGGRRLCAASRCDALKRTRTSDRTTGGTGGSRRLSVRLHRVRVELTACSNAVADSFSPPSSASSSTPGPGRREQGSDVPSSSTSKAGTTRVGSTRRSDT